MVKLLYFAMIIIGVAILTIVLIKGLWMLLRGLAGTIWNILRFLMGLVIIAVVLYVIYYFTNGFQKVPFIH